MSAKKKALGTAGAIGLVEDEEQMADDFLVINGDILTDLDFRQLLSYHRKQKAMATLTVKERVVKTDFGVIKFDAAGILTDYIEKPEHKSYVSIGINVLNKHSRKYIAYNESIGIPELMLKLRNARKKVVCFKTKADWMDLGRLDDFEAAQEIFARDSFRFLKSNEGFSI